MSVIEDNQIKRWDTIWYTGPISIIEDKEQLNYYLKLHFIKIFNRVDYYYISDAIRLIIDYPADGIRLKLIYDPNAEINVWQCYTSYDFRDKLLFQTDALQEIIYAIINYAKVPIDQCLERGFLESN